MEAPKLAAASLVAAAAFSAACWTSPRRDTLEASLRPPGPTDLAEGARPDPLVVEFAGSAAPLEAVGKTIERGVSLKPALSGAWRWEDDRRLVFTPARDWPAGRRFTVSLERELLPARVRLKERRLSFTAAAFAARLASCEFHVDPVDPRVKRVVATVRFTHPVDPESFERLVSLEYRIRDAGGLLKPSGRYAFTVAFDKRGGQAYIQSAPIAIPSEDAQMLLTVRAGARPLLGGDGAAGPLEARVRVPGMYDYFRVESAESVIARDERREPKQTLVLSLSAPAHERDVAGAVHAWVLPVATRPWTAERVGPEELARSTRAALTPVPGEREHGQTHAFRLEAPAGRRLFVRIPKGLRGYGGYELARAFETLVPVPEYPKELKLLHEGAVLRLSGERKLSVYALGVERLRFELGRVRDGEIAHLVTQSHGDYAHPAFEDWRFGEDDLVERSYEERALRPGPPGRGRYTALDLSARVGPGRRGLFFVRAQEWDPRRKRPTGLEDRRFVLVTDLGLVVKASPDGRREALVQSLATGGPVEGALVEVLGRNGAPIVSARTDASGRARFPSLKDFAREKAPAAYVARRGEDLAFLPYARADRRLDFSRFDVGGEATGGARDRLEAYLFTDRGLYRPGEQIKAGVLVRALDWTRPLAGLPVEAVVTDARGLEVDRRKIALSTAAFEEVSYRTQEHAPTGRYGIALYVVKDGRRGALLGATSARVEEFLPDRMKISAAFPAAGDQGWATPRGLSARVTLRTLFGAPAADRRLAARVSLSPAAPRLPRFPGYRFFDPALAKKTFTEELPDARTDQAGEAELAVDLSRFSGATYRATLEVEGFEAGGGRGVAAEASIVVSPRPYLVGVKPDGDLTYVRPRSARALKLAAAGPDGSGVSVSSVTVQLVELKHVSALVRQPDGTHKYQSVKKELVVSTSVVSIPARGLTLPLDAGRPGEFELVLRDEADLELNRVRYFVAGDADLSRSLEKTAELQLRLPKADFAPGEQIELQLRGPYAGSGLITIERDRVYAHKWFTAATSASTQTIRVPEDLEGGGYLVVTLARAPGSREIFMSPLSYAAIPFSVQRGRRELPVTLEAPELARPGERLRLRYRTARPSRLVVFAVDEGILQAAGYSTPDPLARFLRKRALEVETFQLLDLLLPEHRLLEALSAAGGDKGAEAIGRNLNPFKRKRDKPAVFWSGVVDAGPQWRQAAFDVPDSFNGRLRVMAVAATPAAIGAAERGVTVRAPLVLSPNAPLFAAPGDEFEASVGVANLAAGTGPDARVLVELRADERLELLDGATRELRVPEGREGLAAFRLRARRSLGSADLRAVARSGPHVSTRAFSLSIRPLSPYAVDLSAGYVRSGKADARTPRKLYPAHRALEATASRLPLALAGGLLKYVDEYPFECTEQLVSKAFALLAVRRHPALGGRSALAARRMEQALAALRARQTAEGSFGYWAANSFGSPYVDAYAMHFLTEAKDAGYAVPEELMARGLSNLRAVGRAPGGSIADARERAYALYVLTRNGVVTTAELSQLRRHLESASGKTWTRDLAAGYMAATYKLLRLDGEADLLMLSARIGAPTEPDHARFYDATARDAQLLYLLARHFPGRLEDVGERQLSALAEAVNADRCSTLSAAHAVIALAALADALGEPSPAEARVDELVDGEARALPLPAGLFPKASYSPRAERVRVTARGDHGLFYSVVQAGFDLDPPQEPLLGRLEVQRELRDASGKPVSSASVGEELSVHVKIRALGGETVPGVAIVDLLPAGFDVVLDGERAAAGWQPEWTDAREDRLLVFGSVGPRVQEYVYRVKAVARGTFAVPPAFAQGMYDRSAQARSRPARLEVR